MGKLRLPVAQAFAQGHGTLMLDKQQLVMPSSAFLFCLPLPAAPDWLLPGTVMNVIPLSGPWALLVLTESLSFVTAAKGMMVYRTEVTVQRDCPNGRHIARAKQEPAGVQTLMPQPPPALI